MYNLERVVIVGGSCAGKSTLARRLSAILHIPHIELDELYWGPDWQENPPEKFRENLRKAVSDSRWVCDGNYTFARDLIWPRATTLLWLNYSFLVVFGRAIRRTISRCFHGTEIFSGNRETFSRNFFSRESILLWIIQTHRRRQKEVAQLLQEEQYSHLNMLQFCKPTEVERFLSRVCS